MPKSATHVATVDVSSVQIEVPSRMVFVCRHKNIGRTVQGRAAALLKTWSGQYLAAHAKGSGRSLATIHWDVAFATLRSAEFAAVQGFCAARKRRETTGPATESKAPESLDPIPK